MTVIAVAVPFLVGRWIRNQARLQLELERKAERRERERERDARYAAEEERMRIAGDLQAAVADRLEEIVRQARQLSRRLAAADSAPPHELIASIAASAREALADVRRVLGILRRDGQAPRLEPPVPGRSVDAAPPATTPAGPDAAEALARRRWPLPRVRDTRVLDVRGRFASDGVFDPFAQELDDGEDTVAWVAAQPFCDGRVAMYGASYVGATQLLAAVRAPAALTAVAPASRAPSTGTSSPTRAARSSSAFSPTGRSRTSRRSRSHGSRRTTRRPLAASGRRSSASPTIPRRRCG